MRGCRKLVSIHARPAGRPARLRPQRPPHCLKKKATPWQQGTLVANHRVSHSALIGLAPGPLSPPTMTQSMLERSSAAERAEATARAKGSAVAAGTSRRWVESAIWPGRPRSRHHSQICWGTEAPARSDLCGDISALGSCAWSAPGTRARSARTPWYRRPDR